MKSVYSWDNEATITEVVRCIKDGQAVLADSDTVLGLFAAVTQKGVQQLDFLKNRKNKPYLIILGSKHDWILYAKYSHNQAVTRLIDACWPGPLTLILPMRDDLPGYVGSPDRAVALRVPEFEPLRAVAALTGGIFSTSANKAGQPIPATMAQVDSDIVAHVACIVTKDEKGSVVPSTILDCTGEAIHVVREGAFSVDELEKIAGQPFI